MKELFDEILNQFDVNPVDFRFEDGLKLFSNFKASVSSLLKPIGTNNAGCLICIWNDGKNSNQHPVVWIDSEGTPNAVFANNMYTFLSLLPYGTGTIYEIIKMSERMMNKPNLILPEEKYKHIYEETFLKNIVADDKMRFKELMLQKLKITTSIEPAKEILLNYRAYKSLTLLLNK